MEQYEPYISLSIALAAGLLVGMQREQAALSDGGREDRFFVGGIRTYPLFALAGAIAMMLSPQTGMWLVGAVFAALAVPQILSYYDDVSKERDRGLTSETSFVITYLLGVLTASEHIIEPPGQKYLLVAAIAVALTALLSLKQPLHTFAARVSMQDIYATLKFLILAVIVLPILPNETMGPMSVLNPFQIGLMVVLMAGIGFAGYVLIRALGPGRGLALTGFIGGLVSSTVVTLSMSGRAKREPGTADICALAVVLASTVMLVRMAILTAAVHTPLLWMLAPSLGLMLIAGLVASFSLYKKGQTNATSDTQFTNPFEMGMAFKFGLLFSAVLLAAKAAQIYLGHTGMYAASLMAGTTDMDAITLTMSDMAKHGTDARVSATAILLACASNTVVKGVMAVFLGGWLFGMKVVKVFVAMLVAGALGCALIWS